MKQSIFLVFFYCLEFQAFWQSEQQAIGSLAITLTWYGGHNRNPTPSAPKGGGGRGTRYIRNRRGYSSYRSREVKLQIFIADKVFTFTSSCNPPSSSSPPIHTGQASTNIFSTVILASHSLLQFVAFWCRCAFIVASDWFVLPI